ncbi:MAG: TerB family tellurite resistance protein [Ectothiorhodospiraceae bacterium]|nr:TerB family tellurite resistance protein [Ectothiorhodospiraceae bacterium]
MLAAVRRFFRQQILEAELKAGESHDMHALQLAATALLMEVARVDSDQRQDTELEVIAAGIRGKFSLTGEETRELMALARAEADQSVSYYGFTTLINEHFHAEQKERLVELMWRVCVADGRIHEHQEALVRKVADLLYVPHSTFIRAKLRVLEGEDPGEA